MTKTLTEATVDELLAELRNRPGIVTSIWSIEDVIPVIDEHADSDERLQALDDDGKQRFATLFLFHAGNHLGDTLGARGNEFLSDAFLLHVDDILADMESAPSP